MNKRVIAIFTVTALLFSVLFYRIYDIGSNNIYKVNNSKSTMTIVTAKRRGIFYDCNMKNLTNRKATQLAAVVATPKSLEAIKNYFPAEKADEIIQRLSKGQPIVIEVDRNFSSSSGVVLIENSERYTEDQTASHLLGYLDSGNINGVVSLEKSYNEWLNSNAGEVAITYDVDALGRVLTGKDPVISGENTLNKQGVQLTIDSDIQEIVEKYIQEIGVGAVVVMDTSTGNIKAMASVPTYNPTNIAENLNDDNSPFINRAIRGYSLGSIFKLVVAAAALENDVSIDEFTEDSGLFCCEGEIEVGTNIFSCYNKTKHGELIMETALEKSCNGYFITLAQKIGKEKLLKTASDFGFGKSAQLAPEFSASSGILPTPSSIDSMSALANLAFGQGELLVTPLQVASLITCIANGGVYISPKLVECKIDSEGEKAAVEEKQERSRVLKYETANQLKKYMINAVENNYDRLASPKTGGAGAKTATAQSGWFKNSKEVIHTWFAGFYPAQSPKYTIVVMKEDGRFGASDCGPIFKKISDDISSLQSVY